MTDEAAIQQNISRYNEAASTRDWDAAVATYCPDGVWESAGSGHRFEGRDAIRDALIAFTSALEYVEMPTPRPGESEVLVKADTIGVSMPEVLVRRGTYAWMPPLPAIPGIANVLLNRSP